MTPNRQLPLGVFALALTIAIAVLLIRGQVSTDMSGFLPAGNTLEQQFLLEGLRQGPAARVLLLGITGGDQPARIAASRALSEQLRSSGMFIRVENGLSPDLIGPDSLLLRYRYLLDPRPAAQLYSVASLRQALSERLDELVSYGGQLAEQQLRGDPTAAMQTLLGSFVRGGSSADVDEVWQSADQQTALLLLETRASGTDLDAQENNLQLISKTFAALNPGVLELQMTGAPMFAVASRSTITSDVRWLSIAATLLLAALLLVVFRSPLLLLLMTVPLGSGVLAGTAAVILLFGEIHGIALAFGITLLGVAIDYPIHLYSHVSAGQVADSARRIWPTLRLSVLTTAVGYSVLLLTEFPGLAQLGVFNLTGLIAAAVVTRWVLPAIPYRPRKLHGLGGFKRLAAIRLRPGPALLVCLAGTLLLVSGWWLRDHHNSFWDDSLAAISPLDSSLLAVDRSLRQASGASEVGQALIISAATPEQVLQSMEHIAPSLDALVAEGILQGYQLASDWLPSQASQQARQQALPHPDELLRRLSLASNDLGIRTAALQPFIQSIGDSRELPPLTLKKLQDSPLAVRLSPLLQPARQAWRGVIPLTGLADAERLRSRLAALSETAVSYVDQRATTEDMLTEFRRSALQQLAWGALVIILILLLALRSGRAIFQVALPIALALLATLAGLRLLDISLSLFNLIALLLVAGIGIDYALFFARSSRLKNDLETSARTLQSITVSALSSLIVFGLLAQSSIPVLHMLGVTVALGVACSFLLTFIGSRASV